MVSSIDLRGAEAEEMHGKLIKIKESPNAFPVKPFRGVMASQRSSVDRHCLK
jgi:hypothetical protein